MTRSKKTLILHVGTGKTGTTAIQQTFWQNRDALAAAGIAYPATGVVSGAHHLVSPRLPPFIAEQTGWTALAPADWAPAVAALPAPRVFMSSELISSADPATIAAFCTALDPWFDLHVCIYLRRQDDLIAATYAQAVRSGTQCHRLETILDNRLAQCDHLDRLRPWEAALGRDRMIVRPYERSQFHQGDLIRDVALHALGLPDLPPGFVHDPAANPNAQLPAAATEFKRLVNALIADRSLLRRFVDPLSACPPDPKGTHLLGRADRARVIARFADSNATIARTWMNRPDGNLFSPLPADAPETAPRPGVAELRAVATTLGRTAPGLLHDLAALLPLAHRDPLARIAADRLGSVFDGLTMPPRPFAHRVSALVDRLRGRGPKPVPHKTPRPQVTPAG